MGKIRNQGSASLEATLVMSVFLLAMVSLFWMAQSVLAEAQVYEAAAEAAVVAIHKVHTDFDQTTAVNLEKTGLDEAVYDVLVHNKNTVGDPLQIASGKRPQGTNRQAKWVGHWEQKGCYIRE